MQICTIYIMFLCFLVCWQGQIQSLNLGDLGGGGGVPCPGGFSSFCNFFFYIQNKGGCPLGPLLELPLTTTPIVFNFTLNCWMPFLHTFVIANRLHVNGMKSFSVDVIIFIFGWSLNLDVRAVHTANHPREPSFVIKASFRLYNLCFSRWPLDEVYLFLCKGIGDVVDSAWDGRLRQAESISNNLEKASTGKKAQRYKNLHSGWQGMVSRRRSFKIVTKKLHQKVSRLTAKTVWGYPWNPLKKSRHVVWTVSLFVLEHFVLFGELFLGLRSQSIPLGVLNLTLSLILG